ncbi:Gfo/Idh/MocA family protein [Cohnella panacarvi]|uniref:Gfo/Idh/MocA family protein n=1 Tax=Cohnella panacarvi TaxID=400776 RepID=UPI00047B4F8B|nr:Gfo/Idh/MocA family oxidoreductase [Cohnella panacarvi]
MRDLALALIGCGAVAAKHVASIAACPGVTLAALCDVSTERMETMSALWRTASAGQGIAIPVADYRRLLADPAIDAVVVATNSGWHARIATEALQSNKHVVLEKPIALSLREADLMIRLADERGLIVQVCHQLRYRPLMLKLKELVDGGALGRILMASAKLRVHRPPSYYQSSPWRGTWEHDGGMLLNQGIHAIDLLLWYLGQPTRAYGEISSRHSEKETEDVAVGILTFPEGAKAMIEANSVTLPDNLEQSLFILGERGTVSIGGQRLDRLERWYVESEPHAEEEASRLLECRDEHVELYRAFASACRGDQGTVLIPLSEGRRALESVFAIYSSAAEAQALMLPLAAFSTLRMKRT